MRARPLRLLKHAVHCLVSHCSALVPTPACVRTTARVPARWLASSYPSLAPLGSYVADLEARTAMMQVRQGGCLGVHPCV